MKIIWLILTALLFSCSNKSGKQTQSSTDTTGKIPTARLLTDGNGVNDNGFNMTSWNGIKQFYSENGKSIGDYCDYVSCKVYDEQAEVLTRLSDGSIDLIIATGFSFLDAIYNVAPKFPDQKYVLVDTTCSLPNVLCYMFTEEQGSYLVGLAAALQAQKDHLVSPIFGFVGGESSNTILKFQIGYTAGIRAIFPNAKINVWYSESWDAPELAFQKSTDWFDNGTYAIFGAAGGTGNGIIECASKRREAGNNVWAIGVDTDQFDYGTYGYGQSSVLTSCVKRVDVAVMNSLKLVQNDTFQGGVITLSLSDGGVGYTKTNKELPATITDQIDKKQVDITSGAVVIPNSFKDAIASGILTSSFPTCRYAP